MRHASVDACDVTYSFCHRCSWSYT